MPKSWGKTFITLIPKKSNPKFVSNVCLISLCDVSYKIIFKILANHLKHVLAHLINREQCGFVSGHSSFGNIITLQEVTHSINHDLNFPPRMLIEIDIEKSFNTLSWNAILATLTRMKFPSIWIS